MPMIEPEDRPCDPAVPECADFLDDNGDANVVRLANSIALAMAVQVSTMRTLSRNFEEGEEHFMMLHVHTRGGSIHNLLLPVDAIFALHASTLEVLQTIGRLEAEGN